MSAQNQSAADQKNMDSSLVGQKIKFLVGEPWNFHDFVDVESSIGKIESAIMSERDWITAAWSFNWQEREYLFGILRNRYKGEGGSIELLLLGKKIYFNMEFFTVGSQIGTELAHMNVEQLEQVQNHPRTTDSIELIGSIQLASINSPA